MDLADRTALMRAQQAESEIEVVVRRSPRARRYRIEVKRDGTAVLTIPARGSEREARAFLERQSKWLERARERVFSRPRMPAVWQPGSRILFRGGWVTIEPIATGRPAVSLGGRVLRVRDLEADLRPVIEAQFKRIARVEIVARVWELAAVHGVSIRRVSIRGQRTRWGSCSAGGTISLNWRLVQTPDWVTDYVILHELVHTRHMNHSARFWRSLAEICPSWKEAERWLKEHGAILGD